VSSTATQLESPYKGLAPFEDSELDSLLFFGRERETEVIVANLLASKLTVLYGPSGVGKSSIIKAAVARRLREIAPEADVVVLDEWSGDVGVPDPLGETFLILDQFEEYFLYHDVGPLRDALPTLLERPQVHVALSLREDALARLDVFQARVPGVFANRLRLGRLDTAAARAAIVGPLDRWNTVAPGAHMEIEPALVDDVLREVQLQPGEIEAPYLQLVLERIWETEREAGSSVLHAETFRRLGGAEAIVSAHLERALGALPPREAEIATSALRFLVTPSRTKIAHSFGDLVGYTNESPVELHQVLELLASQRILRAVADRDDDGSRYEIFHDVLAEPVLAWRREFDARRALATSARRHRRLALVAAVALALALAMVALAAYAFSQRSQASKQKRVAQVQREIAIGQREKAEQQRRVAQHQRAVALKQKQAAEVAKQDAEVAKQEAVTSEKHAKASEAAAKHDEAIAQESEAKTAASERQARAAKNVAVRERRNAQRQAQRATTQATVAKVGELVATAEAKLGVDPVQSVNASLAAAKLRPSDRVEDALRDSLQALQERAVLAAGSGPVESAAFSPDGTLVATGSGGGDVRIFRTNTHERVRSLAAGSSAAKTAFSAGSSVAKLAFSPDGRQLAVATSAKKALLVDVATGSVEHVLPHDGAVLDLAYADEGKVLVTGSADRMTRIWDASTGALLHAQRATAAQSALAVSPDGALVAVLSKGQATVHVFSAANGDQVAAVDQPGEVTALAFSPNGSYLVTTGRRNGFVWDAHTWTQLHVLTGHEAAIDTIAFAPDGRVVTGSIDASGRVWDPATGASLFTLTAQQQQKLLAVAVSPDNQQIATASADETVRLWNAPLGSIPTLLAGHTDAVTGVSYSPDGSLLLTASADGTARLWNTRRPALRTLGTQQGAISTVAYDSTGELILSAAGDGTARLWRPGGEVRTLTQGGKVTVGAFAGADVVTAGDDGTAKLWRTADGALLARYVHGSPVRAVVATAAGVVTAGEDGIVKSWSRGGSLQWSGDQGSPLESVSASSEGSVATGADDGTIRLWRAGDGQSLHTLRGHTGAVTSLAFDPSGRLLVSGSVDHDARIWDVGTGRLLHTLAGHTLGVTSVSFSPNGKLVLTSSVDGDARIWSVASGRTLHLLRFHVSTVSEAAFSGDGRWVVTAGPTAAGIWQVRTGRLIYVLNGAHGNLTAAAWAPDSLRIVTGDSGGGVETFACTLCARLPALVTQAKERLAGLG
jgi:WD40 repeat protein